MVAAGEGEVVGGGVQVQVRMKVQMLGEEAEVGVALLMVPLVLWSLQSVFDLELDFGLDNSSHN